MITSEENILAKPISFGSFHFPTRKATEDECRYRIKQYSAGTSLSPNDKSFFEALFTLHSEYDEKVGCGISKILVALDFHKNKCLSIIRVDDSRVIISWRHCIKPYSRKMVVSYAFRRAVKSAVIQFKKQAITIGVKCPVLNIPLTFVNSHVAYVGVTFDDMLTNFLKETGLDYESVELKDPNGNDSDQRGVLLDTSLTNNWKEYHQIKADLSLLSEKANLRR